MSSVKTLEFRRIAGTALAVAFGCGGGRDGGPDFASGTDSAGDAGPSTGGSDADGGLKLDVGSDDGPPLSGCDKVDFLFVVDNSGSMADEQQKLVASFPGFMSAIEDTLQAQDYQIMVIDTDGFSEAGQSHGCSPEPCCDEVCTENPAAVCNDVACPAVSDAVLCDARMGSGRLRDSDGDLCPVQGGQRYIVDGQPDLAGTFACLATVGIQGSSVEEPMDSLREATSEELNQAGACNDGFLREDAILVVTFITDEEDRDLLSNGDPVEWRDFLVAAKGGNDQAIVVLGIVGDELDFICPDGNFSQDAPRLRHFVSLFGPRGFVGSICEADFTSFFLDAVATIDTTCDEFVPEG